MATVSQHLEPPTNGKVIVNTTVGEIDVELWPKEAPLACRNFCQLCLEGYYDGLEFHRVIKGFMAQTGDPTGTGTGGEAIYDGGLFKDEFHSRLRFSHRGIVAMASYGPDTNGSQFFFTLGECRWLDKKHTIFGKVTGDTIYNMDALGDFDTDKNDRPLYPPKIISTEVINCPFDDIYPREKKRVAPKEVKKPKEKLTKKANLLSFGEEAELEEEEAVAANIKIKSSHEVLNDPRLSKDLAVKPEELKSRSTEMENIKNKLAQMDNKRQKAREKEEEEKRNRPLSKKRDQEEEDRKGNESNSEEEGGGGRDKRRGRKNASDSEDERESSNRKGRREEEEEDEENDDDAREDIEAGKKKAAEFDEMMRNKIAKARAMSIAAEKQRERDERMQEMRNLKKEIAIMNQKSSKPSSATGLADSANREFLTALERKRQEFKDKKKMVSGRESMTLAKLAEFSSKLKTKESAQKEKEAQKEEKEEKEKEKDEEEKKQKYELGRLSAPLEDYDDRGWKDVELRFKKEAKIPNPFERNHDDDYVAIDPRKHKKPRNEAAATVWEKERVSDK